MRDLKDKNGITNEALGEILDSTLSILDEPTKFKELIDVSNQIFNTINKTFVTKVVVVWLSK